MSEVRISEWERRMLNGRPMRELVVCYEGTDEPISARHLRAARALCTFFAGFAGWQRSDFWAWKRAGGVHASTKADGCTRVCCK